MSQHYHPRIYPANSPLLTTLPPSHPAVRALQLHAESRDLCVGKEIEWPHLGVKSLDQSWPSEVSGRPVSFSGIAYEYLSYDLVLDGWLKGCAHATADESTFLSTDYPRLIKLLAECRAAAVKESNPAILPLVDKAESFANAYRAAIVHRVSNKAPCTSM